MPLNTPFVLLFLLLNKTYTAIAEDIPGEKISLSVPQLTEEENLSKHMPSHLRCDACLAVVHQIDASFMKFMQKRSTSPSESEILEIIENTCNSGFENYGLKRVKGINRLSGPGLETESVMGMTQMGGLWPNRLQDICHHYTGEVGELDIHDLWKKGKDDLKKYLCFGKGTYGHCSHIKSKRRTEL